jgi:hypothetical protein
MCGIPTQLFTPAEALRLEPNLNLEVNLVELTALLERAVRWTP